MPRSSRVVHLPQSLDVAAFCRDAASITGQWSTSELPRLAESVRLGDDGFAQGPIDWAATGLQLAGRGATRLCAIDLAVRAGVVMDCQRCLQPMAVPVHVQRRIRFVEGEDEAARLDEELEDDVLAMTPRLDLRSLIEDELLMALPLVPRHEACPDLPAALRASVPGAQAGEPPPSASDREHPFAALAALRRPKT